MKYYEGIFYAGDCPINEVGIDDHILLSDGTIVDVVCKVEVIGDDETLEFADDSPSSLYTFYISQNSNDSIIISKIITDIPGYTMVVCYSSDE